MTDTKLNMIAPRALVATLGICASLMTIPVVRAQAPVKPPVNPTGTAANANGPSAGSKEAPKLDILQMRSQFANRVPAATQGSQPPAGFPVPIYSFNATSANFNTSTSPKFQAMSGTIMTKDNPQQAYQWYKSYFSQNGWTIADPPAKPTPAEQQGRLVYITASKDRFTVTVSCVRTPKLPVTIINISAMGATSSAGSTGSTGTVGSKAAPAK